MAKGKYGFILFNKNDIYIGRAIEKYGEYSEAEVDVFRQFCRTDDIVIEVGANIGAHTLALSHLVGPRGRIYAYEPQRIVFQTLCANMALNSIENVECYQMAVSSENGFVSLPDLKYDCEGNFGGFQVADRGKGTKVQTIRLDDLIDIPKLKLLKIDVEGMEYDVILGAEELIRIHRPFLYVENDRPEKSKALIERIASLDYRLFWHRPPLFNPNNFADDKENIYPNIISFNMLCVHHSVSISLQGFSEILDSDSHPTKQG